MLPLWKVGDILTHTLGDLHRVLWTDADDGQFPDEVEVVCIRSSSCGRYQKGDRERNVVWTFHLVVSAEEIGFKDQARQAA